MPTENEQYDWLTYESVFNKPRFRKPNKRFDMRLYLVPREKVTVWFRDGLEDDPLLENLTRAFFPEFNAQKHLKASNREWEWKGIKDAGEVKNAVSPQVIKISATRVQLKLQQPGHVILPYNIYDNASDSRAFGTKAQGGFKKFNDDKKWAFWKTASRSCVVRLEEIEKGDSWADKTLPDWTEWDFDAGNADRYPDFENVPLDFLLKDSAEPTLYSLKSYTPFDVSLKTGVNFVGSHKQANKDILDDNWIVACLRSDYVVGVEKEMEGKTNYPSSQDVVVLTELLSINEKDKRTEGANKVRDGVQVRDISKLDRTKLFFGPLSIPFVDTKLSLFQNEFTYLDNKEWCNYWKRHWAASLGQAKALFLLRYGLQHINPNVQNYLIEFKEASVGAPEPTGRIIIRDLQDASIHREVVWALYGNPGEAPPEGADKKAELSNLDLPVLKYEFEKALDESQETGSTDTSQFGPEGTQFLWQRFSTFMNGTKISTVKNQEPFKSKGKELLAVMAEWGKAHNRSYVGCVERQLGINFTDIKWEDIPNPERYRTLDSIDKASTLSYDVTYQFSDSKESPPICKGSNPPKITSIASSALPGKAGWEQKLDVAFNLNLLKVADTFVTVDDIVTMPIPDHKQLPMAVAASAPCIQISGENFQNCSVEIDGKAATNVWLSKDGKTLFAIRLIEVKIKPIVNPDDESIDPSAPVEPDKFKIIPDDAWIKRVAAKNAPVAVINHEDAAKTKPVGQTICKPELVSIKTDMGWEENAAKVVHNYLKSKEGQKAVRDYKARGWKPMDPKFRLHVLDGDDKPFGAVLVKISDKTNTWTDMTDINGEISIYRGDPEDYSFWLLGYGDSISNPERTVSELKNKPLHFGTVQIKYKA